MNGVINFNLTKEVQPVADKKAESGKVPVMQKVLDNPFLLLFLGVVFPTVFYVLWGIMEIISIPVAPY